MADPLKIEFQADTSRAQAAMASLAASVLANMATTSVALSGMAGNMNQAGSSVGVLQQNLKRAATAVSGDIRNIAAATSAAATAEKATLEGIVKAFTAASVTSATAQASVRAGIAGTSGALSVLTSQLPSLKLIAGGLAGVVASYALVSSAVSQANAQLDRFTKLGDDSAKAGVGVEFFQRFADAAEKAKIDVKEIETALRKAGDTVTPRFQQEDPVKKRLNELFETGFTGGFQSKGLADYNAAGNNEQRIRAAVTAMQELRDLGLQVAAIDVAEKLFGAETANRIATGRLEIDAIATALDRKREDLISQAQVQQANEFRQQLADAYKTIDDFFHVSVALEGSGRAVLDVWLLIAQGVAQATVNAGNFYTKIQELQGPLGNYIQMLGTAVAGTAKIFSENLNDRVSGARVIYDKPAGPDLPAPAPNQILNPPLPPRRDLGLFLEKPHHAAAARSSGGSPTESLDAVETLINQIQKAADTSRAELENVAKTNVERERAVALAKAEAAAREEFQKGKRTTPGLDDDERTRTLAAATAMQTYRDSVMDANQALRQTAEQARYFGQIASDSLSDAILEGRSFSDILGGIQKQIARAAIQGVLTGQGPLAGLLGTATKASAGSDAVGGLAGILQGGVGNLFRANGGPVEAGRAYTVGEMGREMFVPERSGQIVPIRPGAGGGAGGGIGQVTVNNYAGGQVQATAERRSDGSLDIVVRQLERNLVGRGRAGQGGFGPTFNTPGTRKG